MNIRGVIFDLDGTLIDTLEDIAFSMNAALVRFGGTPLAVNEYRRHVGQGLDELARRTLPPDLRDEETVKQCVAAMREVYATRWAHTTRPYPGITTMLAALHERGVAMAVHSNKAHDFTVRIVSHFFGDTIFATVLGGGRLPYKPDPAGALHIAHTIGLTPAELLFVGDSNVDMRTAINAGMCPVGVTWGFRSRQELMEAGAGALIDAPEELIGLLERCSHTEH